MKLKAERKLIEIKEEYQDYVHQHATYLSAYKLYKILHDFDVELEIVQKRWNHIAFNTKGKESNRESRCQQFVTDINMTMAYADRSFQLVVAQAGIYIPFDLITSPFKNEDDRILFLSQLIWRYDDYTQRAITLLPRGSEEQGKVWNQVKSTRTIISTMEEGASVMTIEYIINDKYSELFDDLRQVIKSTISGN